MDQNIIQVYDADDASGQVMTILQPQQATIYTTVASSDEIESKNLDLAENIVQTSRVSNDSNNHTTTTTTTTNNNNIDNVVLEANNNQLIQEEEEDEEDDQEQKHYPNDEVASSNGRSNSSARLSTRFKWTKEKSQVAMNLVKYGCKPKLVSVAVGCSLRTAQKFVETVTPKMEGESFKNYVIRRRGRKSKDVNERLEAIREVLSKDSTKTQVEIAADLKVSNTTVCRDLKKIKGSSTKTTRSKSSTKNPPASR